MKAAPKNEENSSSKGTSRVVLLDTRDDSCKIIYSVDGVTRRTISKANATHVCKSNALCIRRPCSLEHLAIRAILRKELLRLRCSHVDESVRRRASL